MDCTSTQLSYGDTGYFSTIVTSYIGNDEKLRSFYRHSPTLDGVEKAIIERQQFKTDRGLLVNQLSLQYASLPASQKVNDHIALLRDENTFTVTTAHQPAIFTGNLFFIYKIVHAIKLAAYYDAKFPGKKFVPVFYMGCEDADLDELGHIYMDGEKIAWQTDQKGAIGRMKTKGLDKIIARTEGELSVQPFGKELIELLKDCYLGSSDLQTATLHLIHRLFGDYGLIVVVPDNPVFKKTVVHVFEDELFHQRSHGVVEKTIERLSGFYKVQAQPRQINLFYLKDNIRERIEQSGEEWKVVGTGISFNKEQLLEELYGHPERFSPNVILRGLFQSVLLPDVCFIGGGGEIAYWLELMDVFRMYSVPYPVLVVRNSFLVMEDKWKDKLDKLRIHINDIFRSEEDLLNNLVKRESEKKLTLTEEITGFATYYDRLKMVAGEVDDTLTGHVAALQTRAIKPLHELEKKLLRAEKRKFDVQQRQLQTLKKALFPNNSLQERVDNFMPYYAKWGKDFIRKIYDHSLHLEQRFTVITCK